MEGDSVRKIRTQNTRWRRLIGCLKLQVICHQRATNYRALLRKMTYGIRHPMMLRRPVASDTLFWSRKAAWCVCEFVVGLNQIRKNIAPENWNQKNVRRSVGWFQYEKGWVSCGNVCGESEACACGVSDVCAWVREWDQIRREGRHMGCEECVV